MLELVEVEAHAVRAPRYLGRIARSPNEGRDDDRVASGARRRGEHQCVAETKPGVLREPLVDGDGAWCVARRQ